MTFLASIRGKTPKQQAVFDALIEAGWDLVVVPFPGAFIVGHPDNATEIPTPDYAREEYAPGRAYYPFPTYVIHRQLTILYDATGRTVPSTTEPTREQHEIKIRTMFARDGEPPWVERREYTIGLGKAVGFIRGPHDAAPYRKEEA